MLLQLIPVPQLCRNLKPKTTRGSNTFRLCLVVCVLGLVQAVTGQPDDMSRRAEHLAAPPHLASQSDLRRELLESFIRVLGGEARQPPKHSEAECFSLFSVPRLGLPGSQVVSQAWASRSALGSALGSIAVASGCTIFQTASDWGGRRPNVSINHVKSSSRFTLCSKPWMPQHVMCAGQLCEVIVFSAEGHSPRTVVLRPCALLVVARCLAGACRRHNSIIYARPAAPQPRGQAAPRPRGRLPRGFGVSQPLTPFWGSGFRTPRFRSHSLLLGFMASHPPTPFRVQGFARVWGFAASHCFEGSCDLRPRPASCGLRLVACARSHCKKSLYPPKVTLANIACHGPFCNKRKNKKKQKQSFFFIVVVAAAAAGGAGKRSSLSNGSRSGGKEGRSRMQQDLRPYSRGKGRRKM